MTTTRLFSMRLRISFFLVLFLYLFAPLFPVHAGTGTNCITYNNDFSTAGFTGSSDFSILQDTSSYNGHVDCNSYALTGLPLVVVPQLALDRSSFVLNIPTTSFNFWGIYDSNGNTSGYFTCANTGPLLKYCGSDFPDGSYTLYTLYSGESDYNQPIVFYVVDSKFYFSLSDVPSGGGGSTLGAASTTPMWVQDSGNVTFGISILITLGFIIFFGLVFNATEFRKRRKTNL